jgi:hypothetical protein
VRQDFSASRNTCTKLAPGSMPDTSMNTRLRPIADVNEPYKRPA